MTLVQFLTARLAEEHAAAQAAYDRPSGYRILGTPETEDHFALWKPARVLADLDAKRGIMALHEPYEYEDVDDLHCAVCGDVPQVPYPCGTLLVLVQPYADHPDFDPAWAIPPVMLGGPEGATP
jgi:hypothetical protein